MSAIDWDSSPRNWTTSLMFTLTAAAAITVVPWYGVVHGYHAGAWIWFAVLLTANELAITCGYHRLFAHATYRAHPVLRVIYLLFGAMALQNSALLWSAGHRAHHRFIDDPERDPYCARRGFWFSHIGWMLHDYPSGEPDLVAVSELQRDRLLMWQHHYYLPLTLAMNIGLPLLIGWLSGDVVGVFLLAGVLRLVVSHHLTFCINSLAHILGTQPYSGQNTSRDNALVALLTFGEGYHNFHHMFAQDYRNGVRWWQWDPSKWFIGAMRYCGLASNLQRVPWFRIQRAILDTHFRRAERQLARTPSHDAARAKLERLKLRFAEEYQSFHESVSTWTQLREQWMQETRRAVSQRWERSPLQAQLQELEWRLQRQVRRMRLLRAELG